MSHVYNIYPIISVALTLSSISSCLLFWLVNHNSMEDNSVFVAFSTVNEWSAIKINWPNYSFGKKVNNTLVVFDYITVY